MPRSTARRRAHFLRPLVVFALAIPVLLAPALGTQRNEAPRGSRTISPPQINPASTISPPTVAFQAQTDRDSAERGENISVQLFVSNKSSATLRELSLKVVDSDFEIVQPPQFPSLVKPFDGLTATAIIKARDNAAYSSHKVLLTIRYTWKADTGEFLSEQPATAPILVKRRFDEETKGFPGGTAAFFYLLFPIIPAILSYEFL